MCIIMYIYIHWGLGAGKYQAFSHKQVGYMGAWWVTHQRKAHRWKAEKMTLN